MTNFAVFSAGFTTAVINVDETGAILFFDKAMADRIKARVQSLKAEPDSARINFYRNLLRGCAFGSSDHGYA